MVQIDLEKPFNLDNTLTCGQIFRFYKQVDNSYDVILDDRIINVSVKDNRLYVTSNNEEKLKEKIIEYFDLNNDYEKIGNILISKDKKIEPAINFSKGLKIINQKPFETIIEYIISANNSVNSIANAINNISKKYGEKIIFNNKEYYLFPSYDKLKYVSIKEYRDCKVGFRDKYIYEIVQKINNKEFIMEYINDLNTEEALKYLMNNIGIGPKVASCILLFSYKRYDVFPIDTWVKKIMKERYNINTEEKMRKFSKEIYGEYCGLAIQYLFNESRNK
ncbi:MAG: 8-oxoguanine DNA glycosylase [Firmicutes bacterium]|nr:8-oxoguanine DNA glycosylase [Bacillota bacterium]